MMVIDMTPMLGVVLVGLDGLLLLSAAVIVAQVVASWWHCEAANRQVLALRSGGGGPGPAWPNNLVRRHATTVMPAKAGIQAGRLRP
jgi:hypothetical protein